nr:MAG TPA: hypothetical protein [Caudoviricetes sp.]
MLYWLPNRLGYLDMGPNGRGGCRWELGPAYFYLGYRV